MKKIHMMGISGSGMSGVATIASKMGYEVSGCDLKTNGHDASHLDGIDLLVVSPAILYQQEKHPELILGLEKNIVTTWEEFLGSELTKSKKIIAVAGTHGKSTTTGMVGKMLEDNGFDPLVMIGAKVTSWGGNCRYGKGEYFVIEADEFNDNFLHYHPEIIILNNIEFDHPDYFVSEKQLFESFSKFINNLVGDKILIVNWDNEGVRNLLDGLDLEKVKLIKYSRDTNEIDFNLKIIGDHNITNALGVIELGKVLGISKEKITKSIESFKGIGRRMEEIGKNVFDDYAHHPTAIKTTLSALRNKYPEKNIWAIIEPHGYSRTKALLDLYKGVFDSADNIIVGPIFKARDKETFNMSPEKIAIVSGHKNIKTAGSIEEIENIIKSKVKDDDVMIVMGAGNSNLWAKRINVIKNGVSFKDLTTLKVGGKIKNYFEIKNKEDLIDKVSFAKKNKLPIFIIGGGTDIAVTDKDFNGVVIKYAGNNVSYNGDVVTAEAGMIWDDLVKDVVDRNLQGMESLSGIPGTVGASPIQNIGAYGQELSETFVSLTAYDIENEKFVEFSKDKCEFGYRESIFKRKDHWQKFVITDVKFKLLKDGKPKPSYESLKSYLVNPEPSLKDVRNAVLEVRSIKLVNPNEIPNAGSFFKNPIISLDKKIELESKYPDIKIYPFEDGYKVFAGFLIEKAGWKGKELGPVKVSDKHALVITNPEAKGTFEDIKKIADTIISEVDMKFGIKLEPEVQYIDF